MKRQCQDGLREGGKVRQGKNRSGMRRLPPTVHDDVFLVPKNVTGERCIALLITMIRWWEWRRAPEVVKWQQRHHVRWDAADNRNGGAERTVWETLLEMERFEQHAGEKGQGAFALVLDLAKAFERVCVPVVWAWATHFRFPKNFLRVPCGYFQHQRRVQWMCGRASPHRYGHFFCVKNGAACSFALCCKTQWRGDEGKPASKGESFC